MAFNSLAYLCFLPIVVLLYQILPGKIKPYFLLVASYFFYACSSWKLLFLIFSTTLASYLFAIWIHHAERLWIRRLLLVSCLVLLFGSLFIFKYLNFFAESVVNLIHLFGGKTTFSPFSILLPVGISFYTFQTLSYVIDVYRKDSLPVYQFFHYALFVSFFPQLVAGPIERADDLLPQLLSAKRLDVEHALKASRYLVSGYVKKIAIADILAVFVNRIYSDLPSSSGFSILLATLFFYGQIYCDFSGYCDIAKGSAYLFSVELSENFDRPYLADSMSDFYRRWHVSLGRWFRDYLYIPLGGNRHGKLRQLLAMFLVFFFSGLWHGANWTFVLWGLFCGVFVMVSGLFKGHERKWFYVPLTFFLVLVSWIFFRCQSVTEIGICLTRIFTSFVSGTGLESFHDGFYLFYCVAAFSLIVFVDRLPFISLDESKGIMDCALYVSLVVLVVFASVYLSTNHLGGGFIYFQF